MNQNSQRYHTIAITLHWVMALAFILMLASGLIMAEDDLDLAKATRFAMYQWHKSLGVILLLAFFLRLVLRFVFKPPALPASFAKLEALGAKAGHWALYALMIAMPLSGWAMVSASVYGLPTIVFGLFEWPHLPGIAANKDVYEAANKAHEIMGTVFIGLILLHVAAVVKHWVVDKENLLRRMWW